MLRQFHYIDPNGKDQGINVRNRSKELAELLGDVDRIRAERKKARINRNKFGGVEGGAMSGGTSGGSRYGGFGNEDSSSYGGYSGGVYGDGGGFGGNTSGFQDSSSRRDRFEEYDEYDEGATSSPAAKKPEIASTGSKDKAAEAPNSREPEVDILGFDDEIPPETPPKEFSSSARQPVSNTLANGLGSMQAGGADDDFDDFQSATPTNAAITNPPISNLQPPMTTGTASGVQYAAPKPVAPSQGTNLNDLIGSSSISPAPSAASSMASPLASNYNISSPPARSFAPSTNVPTQQTSQGLRPTGYQAATPNYFTSVQVPTPASQPSSTPTSKVSMAPNNSFSKPATNSSASGGDAFGSLWSAASANAGIKKTSSPANNGPNLASMQRQKAAAGIWGAPAASLIAASTQSMQSNGQKSGGALDDLLG